MNYNPNRQLLKAFLIYLAFALAALLIILGTTSCNPVTKLARLEHKYPIYVAEYCANKYPIQEKEITKIEYKQGQTVYDTSFIQVDCDSAIKYQTRFISVPKLVQKVRVDTFYQTKETIKKSTAEIKQIAILTNDNKTLKEKYLWWMKFGIVVASLSLAYIAFKLWK